MVIEKGGNMERDELIDLVNRINMGILFDEIDEDPGFLRSMEILDILPFILDKLPNDVIEEGYSEYNDVKKQEDLARLEKDRKSQNIAKGILTDIIENCEG